MTTTSGRTERGSLVGVAVDHLVLATRAGQQVLVRLDRVAVARPDPDGRVPVAQGEREHAQDLLLLERCARWAADRPAIAVAVTGGGDLLRGRLLAVGEDVLTMALDGSRLPTYVADRAIEVVALELSGRA